MVRFAVFGVALCCLCLTGCDVQLDKIPDLGGLDLSNSWPVIAVVVLAYLADSKGQFAAIAGTIKKLLQGLRILPADGSDEFNQAAKFKALLDAILHGLTAAETTQVHAQLLQIQSGLLAKKAVVVTAQAAEQKAAEVATDAK